MSTPSIWALAMGISFQGISPQPYSTGHIKHGQSAILWKSSTSMDINRSYGMMQLRHQRWSVDYRQGFAGQALYLGQNQGSRQWQLAHNGLGQTWLHWIDANSSPGLKRIRWSLERQTPVDMLWRFEHGELGWHEAAGYYASGNLGNSRVTCGWRPDGYAFGAFRHQALQVRLGGRGQWQESQFQVNLGRASWSFQEMHNVRHGLSMYSTFRYRGTNWSGQYQWQHHHRDIHRLSLTIPRGHHQLRIYCANDWRDQHLTWAYRRQAREIRCQLSPDYLQIQWFQSTWRVSARWHHQRNLATGLQFQIERRWQGRRQAKKPHTGNVAQQNPKLWILTSGTHDHPPLPIELIDSQGRIHRCTLLPIGKQLKNHLPPGVYRVRKGAAWPRTWDVAFSHDWVDLSSGVATHWPIHISRVKAEPRWINPDESLESDNL